MNETPSQPMSGRRENLAEWARRWNSGLTRFLRRRVRQPVDAEDLAQEVYLRLMRVEQFDLIEEPQAYLYRVASNVAAEWRMRASQSKPHGADELDSLIEAATPESLIDEAQLKEHFNEALDAMAPMVRAVTFLKLRQSMSHEEIAGHLGITNRMVRRLLGQGYAQLREHMVTD